MSSLAQSPYLEISCLIYVISVCLHIVISNTYCCVVFLFCLSSFCVPNVASVFGCFILHCFFGFL